MSQKTKLVLLAIIFLLVGIPAVTFLFLGDIAVLNPQGMIGEKQRDLLTISTVLMLIVVLPVFALTFGIAWKYRSDNRDAKYTPDWHFSWALETLWWTIPLVIITILSVFNWINCFQLDPFRPIESETKAMKIQAVALQWKWLFIFPEQGIATVNYFHFPEKTPIHFEITADAPMNSFWIPQLGGQVYAMPGMQSQLHLVASDPGSYRGSSANISGEGFSGMVFEAVSTSREEFNQWVSGVQAGGNVLNYEALTKPSRYVPVASYTVGEENLFNRIVMKFMGGRP